LREHYEDWLDRGRPLLHVHTAWIRHVLENLLEWPTDFIAEGQSIPAGLEATQPHFGETLRPDLVLRRPRSGTTPGVDADTTPQLLIVTYPPGQDLEKPVAGKIWKASPATRMTELLHASGVPLGLVTNGEHWMLVYSPRGETSGFSSWYADLWMQEPITLRAFHSLLHLRRFFGVAAPDTLAALFTASSKDQQEVTDQLGRQVRRAVEMLVQAFDQIDEDSGREWVTSTSAGPARSSRSTSSPWPTTFFRLPLDSVDADSPTDQQPRFAIDLQTGVVRQQLEVRQHDRTVKNMGVGMGSANAHVFDAKGSESVVQPLNRLPVPAIRVTLLPVTNMDDHRAFFRSLRITARNRSS
jgi:hypothetical protein